MHQMHKTFKYIGILCVLFPRSVEIIIEDAPIAKVRNSAHTKRTSRSLSLFLFKHRHDLSLSISANRGWSRGMWIQIEREQGRECVSVRARVFERNSERV